MKKAKKTGKKPPLKKALSASKKKRKSAKKTLSVKARAAAPSKKAQSRRKKKPVAAARATATKTPLKSAAKKPLKARPASRAQATVADNALKSARKKILERRKALARGAIYFSEKPPAFGKKVRFKLKNVRCFEGEQSFEIRPLTFITGENSTGKTTLIGCFHTLFHNIIKGRDADDFNFNEEPYDMGSFDTIASAGNGKSKQVGFFDLGMSCEGREYTARLVRDKNTKRPVASDIKIFMEDIAVHLRFKNKEIDFCLTSNAGASLNLRLPRFEDRYRFKDRWARKFSISRLFRLTSYADYDIWSKKLNKNQTELLGKFQEFLFDFRSSLFPRDLISLAPVRSKPKRFYSSFIEQSSYDPEGANIPMRLRDIKIQDKKLWKDLLKKLKEFGEDSELFYGITIKEHLQTGHFELHLKTKTSVSNIRDTGYGTSQILPVLTDLFQSPQGSRLLLQQPEVHLHPKAQAQLSSLFVDCVKNPMNKSFLIETHSDYMVDRARTAVRKGFISADDLSLIYLESRKGRVRAHNILFDEKGDMIKVPEGYRDFFLEEMDDFLGIED